MLDTVDITIKFDELFTDFRVELIKGVANRTIDKTKFTKFMGYDIYQLSYRILNGLFDNLKGNRENKGFYFLLNYKNYSLDSSLNISKGRIKLISLDDNMIKLRIDKDPVANGYCGIQIRWVNTNEGPVFRWSLSRIEPGTVKITL